MHTQQQFAAADANQLQGMLRAEGELSTQLDGMRADALGGSR